MEGGGNDGMLSSSLFADDEVTAPPSNSIHFVWPSMSSRVLREHFVDDYVSLRRASRMQDLCRIEEQQDCEEQIHRSEDEHVHAWCKSDRRKGR